MRLFPRMLGLMREQMPQIFIILLLSFFYITFNSATLWLSGTFIGTLFIDPDSGQTSPGAAEILEADSVNNQIKNYISNIVTGDTPAETLKMVCLILIGCFLLKNMVDYAKKLVTGWVEIGIVTSIRNMIFTHMHTLPLSHFDRSKSGELLSLASNDVTTINGTLRSSFEKMIVTPLEIIGILSLLFIISPKLTAYALIMVPLIGFVIGVLGASIRRKSRRMLRQVAEVVHIFQENLGAMKVVKAFATEEKEVERYTNANAKYFKLSFRQKVIGQLSSPLNETLGAGIGILLLWYGGTQVFNADGITAEDFVRFVVLLFALFQPIKNLSGLNISIQTGLAAGERVFQFLDTKSDIVDKPNARVLEKFKNQIELRHVSFTYAPELPNALTNINLIAKSGEIVAFVGQSGAGKTTIANLIPRFYDVTEGAILIDGLDIRDVTLKSLRQLMGIVTQESILFNDTVRANIGYSSHYISEEEIIEAAMAANAWEFIERMEKGLDTIIGERGVKISGGQRQRLSIARAIANNPPILILDEATSALDSESEKLVQTALNRLMTNRTVFVIAHRLSTIVNAHKIVVLKDGKIMETGRHEELLTKNGYYKKLYEMQFAIEEEV